MINTGHSILIVAIAAAVTAVLRYLPFLVFPENKKLPKVLTYLSNVLPAAIMGMLVVYCFKSTSIVDYPHGIPELIAAAIVVLLYIWRRKYLIAIAAGTVAYMLMVQLIFV